MKHKLCKRLWCYTKEPCMQPTSTSLLVQILLQCTLYTDCRCIVQSVQYQLRHLGEPSKKKLQNFGQCPNMGVGGSSAAKL